MAFDSTAMDEAGRKVRQELKALLKDMGPADPGGAAGDSTERDARRGRMNEQEQRQVVPIFEKDGNRFFVNWKDFVGVDEDEAWRIAVGASLVECILWGAPPTWETLDVTDGILHRKSWLNEAPISVISGPLFDAAVSVVQGGVP